jgi:hypothetical protein
MDNKAFRTVLDKTNNNIFNVVEFDEIEPVKCRYIRFAITDWPKESPLGVIEFTVFGRPID